MAIFTPAEEHKGEVRLRFLSLITAALALFMANAANAQDWGEYSNRENFFTVNFPGDPVEKDVPYKTAKGTNLTAQSSPRLHPPTRFWPARTP